jgi:hypothetical protein
MFRLLFVGLVALPIAAYVALRCAVGIFGDVAGDVIRGTFGERGA